MDLMTILIDEKKNIVGHSEIWSEAKDMAIRGKDQSRAKSAQDIKSKFAFWLLFQYCCMT